MSRETKVCESQITKLAIAVLSILSAVAAAYFVADVTGSEVEIIDNAASVPPLETLSPSPAMLVPTGRRGQQTPN